MAGPHAAMTVGLEGHGELGLLDGGVALEDISADKQLMEAHGMLGEGNVGGNILRGVHREGGEAVSRATEEGAGAGGGGGRVWREEPSKLVPTVSKRERHSPEPSSLNDRVGTRENGVHKMGVRLLAWPTPRPCGQGYGGACCWQSRSCSLWGRDGLKLKENEATVGINKGGAHVASECWEAGDGRPVSSDVGVGGRGV